MSRMSMWSVDRPVLVTGATGLLGGWLVHELLAQRARVVALVRDHVPRALLWKTGAEQQTVTVRGEVEDLPLLERVLNEYDVETVFHLAAQTQVTLANRHPVSTFETNIRGTWNVLEACRRVGCVERIIIASSDKAYGDQPDLPYEETAPLQGKYPYDVSKSCADLIAQSYFHTYGLPVCTTRCGNLFGGGDLNFQRLVPGTVRSALQGERPVIRTDGTLIRDYIYVRDAALAYISLVEQMRERGLAGQAFNFSLERPLSVREMVNLILTRIKVTDLKPKFQNQGQNEIPVQVLSARKAREVLGWCPRYDLETALDATIEWYRLYFQGSSEFPVGR